MKKILIVLMLSLLFVLLPVNNETESKKLGNSLLDRENAGPGIPITGDTDGGDGGGYFVTVQLNVKTDSFNGIGNVWLTITNKTNGIIKVGHMSLAVGKILTVSVFEDIISVVPVVTYNREERFFDNGLLESPNGFNPTYTLKNNISLAQWEEVNNLITHYSNSRILSSNLNPWNGLLEGLYTGLVDMEVNLTNSHFFEYTGEISLDIIKDIIDDIPDSFWHALCHGMAWDLLYGDAIKAIMSGFHMYLTEVMSAVANSSTHAHLINTNDKRKALTKDLGHAFLASLTSNPSSLINHYILALGPDRVTEINKKLILHLFNEVGDRGYVPFTYYTTRCGLEHLDNTQINFAVAIWNTITSTQYLLYTDTADTLRRYIQEFFPNTIRLSTIIKVGPNYYANEYEYFNGGYYPNLKNDYYKLFRPTGGSYGYYDVVWGTGNHAIPTFYPL